MRKPIIAGNWKLNKTEKEAVELATALRNSLVDVEDVDIALVMTRFIAGMAIVYTFSRWAWPVGHDTETSEKAHV